MCGSILPVFYSLFLGILPGGLVPIPGHTEGDNSPPPGLLINQKYAVFVKIKIRILISVPIAKEDFFQELDFLKATAKLFDSRDLVTRYRDPAVYKVTRGNFRRVYSRI